MRISEQLPVFHHNLTTQLRLVWTADRTQHTGSNYLVPVPPPSTPSFNFTSFSLPLISSSLSALSRPLEEMTPTVERPCAVCGVTTTQRCSSCAEHDFELFICGREHQKLVRCSFFSLLTDYAAHPSHIHRSGSLTSITAATRLSLSSFLPSLRRKQTRSRALPFCPTPSRLLMRRWQKVLPCDSGARLRISRLVSSC